MYSILKSFTRLLHKFYPCQRLPILPFNNISSTPNISFTRKHQEPSKARFPKNFFQPHSLPTPLTSSPSTYYSTSTKMSTAASPAPSEGDSKRGEVTYRFCQDWSVPPLLFGPRNSLTSCAVQTSSILKKIAQPHNSFSCARHATPPRFSITLAPTATTSAPLSQRLLVLRRMLQMIQLCVMNLLYCSVSVLCAENKSGAEGAKSQHWRS